MEGNFQLDYAIYTKHQVKWEHYHEWKANKDTEGGCHYLFQNMYSLDIWSERQDLHMCRLHPVV
jgi:hypothetical protein